MNNIFSPRALSKGQSAREIFLLVWDYVFSICLDISLFLWYNETAKQTIYIQKMGVFFIPFFGILLTG